MKVLKLLPEVNSSLWYILANDEAKHRKLYTKREEKENPAASIACHVDLSG